MTDNFEETLRDEIIEQGEKVFLHYWYSGGPGAGADSECIYRYNGQYYPILSYDYETQGCNSLEEALESSELSSITEATEEISFSPELEERLLPLFKYIGEEDKQIKINGETWLGLINGELRKYLANE